MHALRRIHRALRPGGLLLDVHPEPDDYRLTLVVPGAPTRALGWVRHEPEQFPRIRASRAALAETVAEGLYAREERRRFPMSRHVTSRADWAELLTHTKLERPEADPGQLEAALALLDADEGATLVLRKQARAERLRRLP